MFNLVFIYLLANLRKNCWLDLHEIFTRDVRLDKKHTIKFWTSSVSGLWRSNNWKT